MYYLQDIANFNKQKKQVTVKSYRRKGKLVRSSKRNIWGKAALIGGAALGLGGLALLAGKGGGGSNVIRNTASNASSGGSSAAIQNASNAISQNADNILTTRNSSIIPDFLEATNTGNPIDDISPTRAQVEKLITAKNKYADKIPDKLAFDRELDKVSGRIKSNSYNAVKGLNQDQVDAIRKGTTLANQSPLDRSIYTTKSIVYFQDVNPNMAPRDRLNFVKEAHIKLREEIDILSNTLREITNPTKNVPNNMLKHFSNEAYKAEETISNLTANNNALNSADVAKAHNDTLQSLSYIQEINKELAYKRIDGIRDYYKVQGWTYGRPSTSFNDYTCYYLADFKRSDYGRKHKRWKRGLNVGARVAGYGLLGTGIGYGLGRATNIPILPILGAVGGGILGAVRSDRYLQRNHPEYYKVPKKIKGVSKADEKALKKVIREQQIKAAKVRRSKPGLLDRLP